MGNIARKLYLVVAVFAVVVWNSLPVTADEATQDLIDELHQADPGRAAQIVREVERNWSLSGSTTVDMLLRRGQDAMSEEDWTTAIDHLTAVTDHAPDFAEGFHARATAYYNAGLFGPALDDLAQVLVLNPNHWNALFGLGILFQEFGEHARAADAFRMVLELNPHHENATEALQQVGRFGVGRTL